MDLQLKQLSPYLPYGLKLQFIIRDEVVRTGVMTRLLNYSHETHPERLAIDNYDSEHIWMFKPILRPMSDLLKEIPNDVDNRCFYELGTFTKRIGIMSATINIYTENLQYEDFVILVEHHFDVFGLIDAGLAIDINMVPELLNG